MDDWFETAGTPISVAKDGDNTTEMIKKTFYQYLTGFQLVMAIFILIVQAYGMPEILEETAVYVAVAFVAAVVYWKDKTTSVDLKKIDLTPAQEYQIKSVVEWLLNLLGYVATVEKPSPLLENTATVGEDRAKQIEELATRIAELKENGKVNTTDD